jgi:hypothetical protein
MLAIISLTAPCRGITAVKIMTGCGHGIKVGSHF